MHPGSPPFPPDFYSFLESDHYDPFGNDRLRLYWNHPEYPDQWSLRFCFVPFGPADLPEAPCLEYSAHSWPRDALIRHFRLGPEFASLPAAVLFRMNPDDLRQASAQAFGSACE